MTRAGFPLAVLTSLAVAGCVHTDFTRTGATALPARAPDCHLEIVFNGPPRRPYVVLGQVWTDASSPQAFYGRFDTNNSAPVQRLIQQACVAGAHGLMSVTVQTHRPWGKGWKSTQAAAVAFAYVDASGRVLPPPSGPQVEIPVSAFGP